MRSKTFQVIRTFGLSLAIIIGLSQCSEEQIVVEQRASDKPATVATIETADVASVSVTGLFTEVIGDVACATCSYVVTTGEKTVDGKELGLAPGSVVCLKKSLSYPSIDFVNMEGTEENPIVIGYCSE
ncbi:MAG TPA: hypothetical protein VGD40_24385 [Chryseosolibacter sp.]